MDRKRLGWALAVLGAVLILLAALADPLGLGEGSGIGFKQVTGIVVGAVLIAVGLVVGRRGRPEAEEVTEVTEAEPGGD